MAIEKKNFPLKFPFEFRGANYTEFNARRPKVRDIRNFIKGVEKDGMSAMEKVLADLFEVDNTIIAEIDSEDFAPMKAWFEHFLELMSGESSES
ncbi:phage tail assembly protein [Bradyrhizobium sp. th.b2]|uniref:phage tail assembly protein n=1 Tax=Bradyrhizobium sp. th-b2 TaxID=172088 RepID=UPI00040B981B|nr:phage tail assembly protein [Bradyrhizobium sp. th.b2]